MSPLLLPLSYLLGSIPTGYLVARLRGIDIRRHGSGNIGSTNVLRTLGRGAAGVTLLGDVAKGWAGVWLGRAVGPDPLWPALAAVLVVVGHCWSPFLGFRGGKGVATGFGAALGLAPWATLPAALVWGVLLLSWRYVSLASLSAAVCLPLGVLLLGYPLPAVGAGGAIALLVIARHRENIGRLLAGTERRLGEKVAV